MFIGQNLHKKHIKELFTLINPQPDNQDELKKVFGNLEKNIWIDTEDIQINPDQKFYILGLAPNAARLSVRFFSTKIHLEKFLIIFKNITSEWRLYNLHGKIEFI